MFLDKGELSFFALWVINPLIIVLYQNCSWNPAQRADAGRVDSASSVERSFEKCSAVRASVSCPE